MSIFSKVMSAGVVLQGVPRASRNSEILNRLALLVGLAAVSLPIFLWIGGRFDNSCMRDTISHFYYAPFLGAIFVGFLFFIGGFLIAFSGDSRLEDWGSNIAGVCAIAVAIFPTSKSGCAPGVFTSRVFAKVNATQEQLLLEPVPGRDYFELFGDSSEWHLLAAAGVFLYLGLFCLVVLKRILPEKHLDQNGQLLPRKARRNGYYTICGVVIFICASILACYGSLPEDLSEKWEHYNVTFYLETLILWAFGAAWFIKGRMFDALND